MIIVWKENVSNANIMINVLRKVKTMKETTALNRISKILENINYKSVYIEINTNKNRYTLEKENNRKIGFGENYECKSKHK